MQTESWAEANIYLKGDQKWYGPPFLVGFNVNKSRHSNCKLMTMSGLKYIERIREKQLQEAEKLLKSMWDWIFYSEQQTVKNIFSGL